MSNRAERRRAERESKKVSATAKIVSSVPLNIANYNMQQISSLTGVKVDSLKVWIAARDKELHQAYTEEFQKKLLKAEDYIAVANILISLLAIKMTWGFTRANQKFVGNINAATEYLNRNGVEKVYKELHNQMGVTFEFDSIDINKEFGFGGDEDE